MPEANDVAGEGELDNFVVTVVPTHVMAKRAALDAVKLIACIAGVKQRLAPRKTAHAREPRARPVPTPVDEGCSSVVSEDAANIGYYSLV